MPNPPRSKRTQPSSFNQRIRKALEKQRIKWNHQSINHPDFEPKSVFLPSKKKAKIIPIKKASEWTEIREQLRADRIFLEKMKTRMNRKPVLSISDKVELIRLKVEQDEASLYSQTKTFSDLDALKAKPALAKAVIRERSILTALQTCAFEDRMKAVKENVHAAPALLTSSKERIRKNRKFIQDRFKLSANDIDLLLNV